MFLLNGLMIDMTIRSRGEGREMRGISNKWRRWIMDGLTPKPDPLDESNKSPRIDSAGDKWEWSEFLGFWVLTEPNKVTCRHIGIFHISPEDPGYCYNYSNYRFDSVHSIAEWTGPLVFAK